MPGPGSYDDLPMNWVGDWAGRRAKLTPDRLALYDVGAEMKYTYRQLDERANRIGTYLLDRLGLEKGDSVCVLSRNRIEPIDLYLAAGKTGIVLAPLSHRLTKRELDDLLARMGPKAFFYEDTFAELAQSLAMPRSVNARIVFGDQPSEYTRELEAIEPRDVNRPLTLNDTFLYIHTGGTTATPKVCLIPHRQMLWNSLDLLVTSSGGLGTSRELLTFPLFHIGGWNTLTPVLHAGGYAVMVRQFDAALILELIERERITHFGGVEAMLQFLIDRPEFEAANLESLQAISTAGAPCAEHVMGVFWDRGIRVTQSYGLTEAGPSNFTYGGLDQPLEEIRKHSGSIGTSMFHCDYRIVHQDTYEPVAPGEAGVLCLRSPHNFKAYLDQPDRTESVLMEEGWVYSGDLAREDEEGFVYIVGRADNMFISGGENVSPEEIEQLIAQHPGVDQVAVIGVQDPRWGQAPLAVVVPKSGEAVSEASIIDHCAGRLARFKIPKRVAFVERLPLTGAGKIDRNALKASYG